MTIIVMKKYFTTVDIICNTLHKTKQFHLPLTFELHVGLQCKQHVLGLHLKDSRGPESFSGVPCIAYINQALYKLLATIK